MMLYEATRRSALRRIFKRHVGSSPRKVDQSLPAHSAPAWRISLTVLDYQHLYSSNTIRLTIMTQPLFYQGPEFLFEDDSADTDLYSEPNSVSEAGTDLHADSVTEELHSSVTSSRSSWSFGYHPLIAPPPSPASSMVSSSSDSALRPSIDTSSSEL